MSEPQYQARIKEFQSKGCEKLGLMSSWSWYDDPKRLGFVLARYKFVAKLFEGFESVLEVGCGDGFAARVVKQSVKQLIGIDFDPALIQNAQDNVSPAWPIVFESHDILSSPYPTLQDGIFALDVMEHIPPAEEQTFIQHLTASLKDTGALIIGLPSIHSQAYASPQSRAGHVNCKDKPGLKSSFEPYFHQVFLFSMNDEVLHTGFGPLSQYLFALCCMKKG